jgi:AcrR family transcriptional regulator
MQYLSDRLKAVRTGGPDDEGREARHRAVSVQQRERLLDATERIVAEQGAAGATIERVAKLARVSSASFYQHFEGREELLLAAFDGAVEEEAAALAAAVRADLPWPDQVREGLRLLLAAIEARPQRAWMCLVESQRGGVALQERYEAGLDRALPVLRQGRLLDSAADDLPETLEEATAAGVAWLLRERLEGGGAAGIGELLPQLAEIVLGPYLGGGEALRLSVAGGGT